MLRGMTRLLHLAADNWTFDMVRSQHRLMLTDPLPRAAQDAVGDPS
jgi:hypothetical protein